ncbi:glycosyltransferase [Clostridium beijerinckii]|uniref:Uncharacterized protein n=1 Tax=Clostridium beijerinckii TaxID=1520 RepID=A0AAX0B6K2_CLOBE|nr:glycosyltransferase [Clostridium beijerinckii]NRT90799.1 hypothetical protein [Clostridium beijerinckii]NYC70324.1 glycosyltransferase involved in cell wall biosynthesis/GT2 family glycosyltransferase [Clostridium beijerinckii]
MNKKVSIVICTYNRAAFLNRTLKSLSKLAYEDFEVIVINGPSTDYTIDILEKYKNSIKIANNDKANLSISRNMGIALSSADIVAFIDDDAIPDKYWLNDIVSLYTDETVGGVGGKVYGPGDNHFQFENGYVDIWGYADGRNYGPDYNDPNGNKFNMMLGTNATFLRKALIEIGGFDEYYDYYHDESDTCVRIIQAGYKIFNHERAYIHHEYAKSYIRESTFDGCRLNWYPIVKNKAYFAIKNSINKANNEERKAKVLGIKKEHLDLYKTWLKEKKITKEEYNKFVSLCETGFEKGYNDGYNNERLLNFNLDNNTEFKKYDNKLNDKVISICLLCKDDIISSIGGVAKYTYEIAKGLVKKGHIVHVITGGNDKEEWISTWGQEGINFHKVSNLENDINLPEMNSYPLSYDKLKYSYAVYKKIREINEKYSIDIVESPLWDFEGCVSTKMLKGILPVIVRLQTPLLKVAETQNWKITDDLELFAEFEKEMILNAAGIISISDNITHTISELYDIDFNKLNNSKVYLGVDEPTISNNRRNDEKIRILFVGRLERRKGIHTIFEAIPKIIQKYPNLEFRFVGNDEVMDQILGTTFRKYFNKKYGNTNWAKNVIFLGQISNEEKEQEFVNCDIFIAPSLYESFGIILIEAMSAKKPVIGCRIGGMQEIIKDNYNGFLIDVEDSKQLVDRLEALINDQSIRLEFGENGYRRFEELFSNNSMIDETLKVYMKYI